MAFEKFCSRIADFCAVSGNTAVFGIDDRGKYIARTSDGKLFTGNSASRRVTVQWGDHHQSQFDL